LTVLPRVEASAARLHATVRPAGGLNQAVDACRAEPGSLLVVDLAAPQLLDVGGVVQALKSSGGSPTRVIAFGPHVHESRLREARLAGCDEVFSRGQFFARLDTILSRLTADK
jgi:hypothetical protein